ncbi:IclR family transcriptional regulator [Ammoniphilus sp. 3BR4]|uniref:IclR family transcriptional regulator n=1 Tax=Ammoniphilus sp. 3BR4 TaxID=3158265 RepID=UPI0034655510
MSNEEKDRYLSHSLIRGLEILAMFDMKNPTLSLVEIAHGLGVSRTVPYRLLYTLQAVGLLHQDENTKRYGLTPKVLELGFSYLNTLQLPEIARPYLEQLRDETGASSHLGILDGREVVYVARVPARGVSTVNVTIGSRLPAYATAMGKCLLAFQSKDCLRGMLFGTDLMPYTEHTKTMNGELQWELDSIRKNGFAISNGEFESGIRSIAAPIFDQQGSVIAALNVAASESILKDDFISNAGLRVVSETADALSRCFGYRSMVNTKE